MGVTLVLESAIVPCLCKMLKSNSASCDEQHNFTRQPSSDPLKVENGLLVAIRQEITWIFINLSMGNTK